MTTGRTDLGQGDMDRALGGVKQAVTLASEGEDDSLQVLAYTSLGNIYGSRNEKLSSFRNYWKALAVAEKSKKDALIRIVTEDLTYFTRVNIMCNIWALRYGWP